MNKNADKFAFIATVVFIFIIAIIGCITVFRKYPATDITPSGIKWDGNSITVNRDKPEKYIAIPCFTDVNFISNQTSQKVNIYNPEENECVMSFAIVLSDGTVIWESDNVYPGYGFHDIEITQTLSAGTYEARLITRCFTMDKKSELNGSSFKFKINVIGD